MEETLQVSLQPEEGTEKPGNEKAPSGPPPKEPPSAQNKMMNTARQFSKGSLGLGDSKMASSVMLAMGKKAQKSDAAPAGTPPPNSKPAPNKSGPPGPSGPTKPVSEPSEPVKPMVKPVRLIKKEEDVDPKPGPSRKRHDSQASETSSVSGASSATSAVKKVPDLPKDKAEKDAASGNGNGNEIDEDTITDEDTMKNLKKTFAG